MGPQNWNSAKRAGSGGGGEETPPPPEKVRIEQLTSLLPSNGLNPSAVDKLISVINVSLNVTKFLAPCLSGLFNTWNYLFLPMFEQVQRGESQTVPGSPFSVLLVYLTARSHVQT